MLAIRVDTPFDSKDWIFEIKLDGFRALSYISKGTIQLKSRSNHLLNHQFPGIVKELEKIKDQVILDGEIVVLDKNGRSQFQLIQNYKERKNPLYYFVFDLLYMNGKDLRKWPLIDRKKALQKLLKPITFSSIRYCEHIDEKGVAFFKAAQKLQLEGIIGKRKDGPYLSKRSSDWVKIKTEMRQEFVIGGFTKPKGGREHFGSILVGFYDEGHYIFAGHVGGGFDSHELQRVYRELKPLIRKKCPFIVPPQTETNVTWVKPSLVCEVKFLEWTEEKIMRQPIYLGMRKDKDPKRVVLESLQARVSSDSILTNLDKTFWPKEGYTKGDLIEYYSQIAKTILPYLKDRPIMLHRFPEGIEKSSFYQKNIPTTVPKWVKTVRIRSDGKVICFLEINDLKSLLFAINLGSIDLHPFISRSDKLEFPEFCVIDLDPVNIPFKQVVVVAKSIHNILERCKIKNFCKTSGEGAAYLYSTTG